MDERVARILRAALNAVEPGAAVRQWLRRERDTLVVAERRYDLSRFRRVVIVGAGKAAAPMGYAAAQIVGDRLTGGMLITKEGHIPPNFIPSLRSGQALHPSSLRQAQGKPFILHEASHPLPDGRGLAGTRQILELLHDLREDDLAIALVSGGGSALLISPAPGISLADLQALTSILLACGATIHEINTLRKHLDTVKGGGLARAAHPAQIITLILSDVVGDPLDVIASGPAVPDPSTFAGALAVLEHYHILDKVPASILAHLRRGLAGDVPETPKPGDPLFEGVQSVVVGSNRQACEAALQQARAEGFNTLLLTTHLQGEAQQAGRALASIAQQISATGQPIPRPACVAAGGETTVTLTPLAPPTPLSPRERGERVAKGDEGGRNQELALGAVADLAGLPEIALVTLATDGQDGPTDAAGAVVTGETLRRARSLGLDAADFLSCHDAYHFFEPLGDLIRTGPTRTNVNDLALIFAFARL